MKPRKQHTRWGAGPRAKFLAVLATNANVALAAKAAGMSRSRMYELREADEGFAKEWKDAEQTACDVLEAELFRRAVKGTRRPVYQGGVRVGYVREFSDTCLLTALKAHRPEKYRDRVEHSGKDGFSPGLAITELHAALVAGLAAAEAEGKRLLAIEEEKKNSGGGLEPDENA